MAPVVKNLPVNAGDVRNVGLISALGRSPRVGHVTCSSILAWRIPWRKEPSGLQSMGLQSVRHNWSDLAGSEGKEVLVNVRENENGPSHPHWVGTLMCHLWDAPSRCLAASWHWGRGVWTSLRIHPEGHTLRGGGMVDKGFSRDLALKLILKDEEELNGPTGRGQHSPNPFETCKVVWCG